MTYIFPWYNNQNFFFEGSFLSFDKVSKNVCGIISWNFCNTLENSVLRPKSRSSTLKLGKIETNDCQRWFQRAQVVQKGILPFKKRSVWRRMWLMIVNLIVQVNFWIIETPYEWTWISLMNFLEITLQLLELLYLIFYYYKRI